MIIFAHRRNSIELLLATSKGLGVEIDIRSMGQKIIIEHDPFCKGEDFVSWLENYNHNGIILNVKEEGLEKLLIDHMKRKGIDNFFFLDQSFPFLIKISNMGEKHCAVRVSEFESIETAKTLSGQIDWIWVDYFSRFPLNKRSYQELKDLGFKLCLVSPELQGFSSREISCLQDLLTNYNIRPDAVCTKLPEVWQRW